jgi:hypothetical protein
MRCIREATDSRPSVTSTSPNTCLSRKRANAFPSDLVFPRGNTEACASTSSRPPRELRVPRGSVEYVERDAAAATLLFAMEVKNRKHLADVIRRVRRTGVVSGAHRYPL